MNYWIMFVIASYHWKNKHLNCSNQVTVCIHAVGSYKCIYSDQLFLEQSGQKPKSINNIIIDPDNTSMIANESSNKTGDASSQGTV